MKTEQSCLQLQNRWSSHYAKKKTGNQVLENKNQYTNKREMVISEVSIKGEKFLEQ